MTVSIVLAAPPQGGMRAGVLIRDYLYMNGCENVWADVFVYILTVRERLVFRERLVREVFHFSTLTRPWFISFNCVQTSKVKYFLEFCLRSQVGFKSFVPFSRFQHIMSFQAPSLSNGGLGGTALAMSRAQEELWNQSRCLPAQRGDASVPASFLLGH